MADSVVRAERSEVLALRAAVISFARELREVGELARQHAAMVERRAQTVAEERARRLAAATAALRRAEAAVSRQQGPAGHAVTEARRQVADARREVERARQAVGLAATLRGDLGRAVQYAAAALDGESSVSAGALATLAEKLAEVRGDSFQQAFARGVATMGVVAETGLGLLGMSHLAGAVSQGAIPTVDQHPTSSELRDTQVEHDQELWAEAEKLRAERRVGGDSG